MLELLRPDGARRTVHDTRVDRRNCARYRVEAWSSAAVPRPMRRALAISAAPSLPRMTTVSPRKPSARSEWKRVFDRSVSRTGRPVPRNQCPRSHASRTDRGTVPRALAPGRPQGSPPTTPLQRSDSGRGSDRFRLTLSQPHRWDKSHTPL
jgi:hypothetical protein